MGTCSNRAGMACPCLGRTEPLSGPPAAPRQCPAKGKDVVNLDSDDDEADTLMATSDDYTTPWEQSVFDTNFDEVKITCVQNIAFFSSSPQT